MGTLMASGIGLKRTAFLLDGRREGTTTDACSLSITTQGQRLLLGHQDKNKQETVLLKRNPSQVSLPQPAQEGSRLDEQYLLRMRSSSRAGSLLLLRHLHQLFQRQKGFLRDGRPRG